MCLKAQYAHISAGLFTKEGKALSAGFGIRKGSGSIGITGYYTTKYKTSINADLHVFLGNNSAAFLFFQPGVSLYATPKADIKLGFGYMGKSPGIYFTTGFAYLESKPAITGGFATIGVRL